MAWDRRALDGGSTVDIAAPDESGRLPIHDAVTLSGRTILTAHGDFGVRLIGFDLHHGRTRMATGRLVPQTALTPSSARGPR